MRRLLLPLLVVLLVVAACGRDDEDDPLDVIDAAPVNDEEEEPEEEEPEDTRPRSPLTGTAIDADLLDRPLLIAKIENSPQSRPQSGLDAADVVIEELVEGGITRFMVLFHGTLPDTAGPIRSARPVDTQLVSGYGRSGFAFSGARDEVQRLLAATPSVRITEGGAGFYRDGSRSAPHNLYLRPEDTLAAVADRGAEPITDVEIGWEFDPEPPPGEVTCPPDADDCDDPGAEIQIRMSNSFLTGWVYDADEGVYRRLQNGQDFRVTGDGRIGAANVVVLGTRHYVGASGYPETDVITADERALVLRDGRRYEVRWSKPSERDPILLLDEHGEPFPLRPGPTWLHLPAVEDVPRL